MRKEVDLVFARKGNSASSISRHASHLGVSQKRLVKAIEWILAAVALVLVFSASDYWQKAHAGAMSSNGGTLVGQIIEKVKGGEEVSDALFSTGFAEISGDSAPDWFEKEIADFSGVRSAIANEDASVACLLIADDAESQLLDGLEHRGWSEVQSSQGRLFSFIKEEGACRWLMAEIDPVGEETSVVLHIGRT